MKFEKMCKLILNESDDFDDSGEISSYSSDLPASEPLDNSGESEGGQFDVGVDEKISEIMKTFPKLSKAEASILANNPNLWSAFKSVQKNFPTDEIAGSEALPEEGDLSEVGSEFDVPIEDVGQDDIKDIESGLGTHRRQEEEESDIDYLSDQD